MRPPMAPATPPLTRSATISEEAAVKAALARLAALHPRKIDLSLGRVQRLLDALGRPQDKLPPVIHVAGTNGKGSTIAMLRAFAEAAGLNAHVYTSPHLVRFNERIVLAGREISDEALAALLTRIETANDGAEITQFEITTAAALAAFADTPADIALIEVGLGGRFDATNVFTAPACAAITTVGYDHMEFLGDDLAQIAREKAGIIKPGCPAVVGPQEPVARASIAAEALSLGVRPRMWGADFHARAEHGRLVFEDDARLMDLPIPALRGGHQIANAGVAIAAALAVGYADDDAIARGLSQTQWPARLQALEDGPLAAPALAVGCMLLVDGAHNEMGARALARALADMDEADPRPLVLIVGMQRKKAREPFLEAFSGRRRAGDGAPIAGADTAWSPAEIAEAAEAIGIEAAAADDLLSAVAAAPGHAYADEPGARLVICGSLYLAGEALALNAGRAPAD